ncbi:tetratricopeptide repeat-containing sensor histidine kinase [Niabella drilacis]|uniref:histidine kinase n=1 Tax=Niabella drilacis (strain DSM 25811 / CCM 8410 / CCUG 62505 / LMG 26954 / E90) TaxID=1285928 RepID=A0A1G6MTX7_NIADE|nr:tetratricopeptide repeat-containing sensor histidine kinase [Niabella drilacis]SDC58962.1 Tetratricopeptide repeat-containing protein [Niabella drilacis]
MLKQLHPILLFSVFTFFGGCKESLRSVQRSSASRDYEKGKAFYNSNNDSALYYFNRVVANIHDSLEIAKAYTYIGIIQLRYGDYFGAQENTLISLRYLKRMNYRKEKYTIDPYLISNYNELGRVNAALKNYHVAIKYYDEALKLTKDDAKRIITLSNKAVAYRQTKQYPQAIAIYQSIIEGAKDNPERYARILTNIAYTRWLQDSSYSAAADLLYALQIREKERDYVGLYSSYSHLSDYYARTAPNLALTYAEKMYDITRQLRSPSDELEALQKLITLSPPAAVKKYFTRYQYLNDSQQTAWSNARNQFSLIRYEGEKTKADNLVLQKANAEKKVQIIWQRIILFSVLVLTIIGFWWYRKQKQRAIREQQLKTSKKVHDVVANGLYHVISKVDHDKTGGKEQLLDDLTHLYEQSRNISYEQPQKEQPEFQESIANLLKSFSSETTRISIVGNTEKFWGRLPFNSKTELRHILQELMVNMKKHSAAANVMIRFEPGENPAKIVYTDDGKGLPADFHYGNGLKNTENRISGIGGRIIFGKAITDGLKIELYIPVTQSK